MDEGTPSIDFTFLDSMLNLSKGEPRFVVQTVQRFLKNSDTSLKDIQEFRKSHDREALKQKTHKFISSCSVVGAMRVIELCKQLSKKSDDKDEATILSWLDTLQSEVESAKQILKTYLSKIKAPV